MGSPNAGICAEIKLRTYGRPHKNRIKYRFRYVDDIIAILGKEQEPEEILNELKTEDENLKFTLEVEKEGILNFLDVKIIKGGNRDIKMTVYRKPQSHSEIININCKTPNSYKAASIKAYINRAITICSNQNLLLKEIKEITAIAKRAGCKSKLKKYIREELKN